MLPDNGLGGLSLISTFSWLANFLSGSAGRCYKRFINKMNDDARKSYFCKMHFPSLECTGLTPACSSRNALGTFAPRGTGANLPLSSRQAGTISSVRWEAAAVLAQPSNSLQNALTCQQQRTRAADTVGGGGLSPVPPQPFHRAKLLSAALATECRSPAFPRAREWAAAPKMCW